MNKVDAVVSWINLSDRNALLRIMRTMNENKYERVCLYGQNSISYCIDDSVDIEKIFTFQELDDGLKKFDSLKSPEDKQALKMKQLFEPILLKTKWFEESKAQHYGALDVLAFDNGKYNNHNVQGMFEIFCLQQQKIDLLKP